MTTQVLRIQFGRVIAKDKSIKNRDKSPIRKRVQCKCCEKTRFRDQVDRHDYKITQGSSEKSGKIYYCNVCKAEEAAAMNASSSEWSEASSSESSEASLSDKE
jgi:hypothetical protein